MESKFSIQKVLIFMLLAIALVFSACQNPVSTATADSGTARAAAPAYNVPPSQLPPGGLLVEEAPMFVSLGWDDNGRSEGINWILDYVSSKTNPVGIGDPHTYDGENVSMTFFPATTYLGSSTSESTVLLKRAWRRAYEEGHEFGVHAHSHQHGQNYSTTQWQNEIDESLGWLTREYDPLEDPANPGTSGIGIPAEEINSFRAPYLEYSDTLFNELSRRNWFDCSIEEGWEYDIDGTNHFWPYTLDTGSAGHDAQVEWGTKTPLANHPGLWEMPVQVFIVPPELRDAMGARVSWFDKIGGKITGYDYDLWTVFSMSKAEFLATLKHSFDLRLRGNRAPMFIAAHTDYYVSTYSTPAANVMERRQAIEEFIDYVLSYQDVRMVSYSKVLDWIKEPFNPGPLRYSLEASTNGGPGEITPYGSIIVTEGSDITFNIDPMFGAEVEFIEVNGILQPYTAKSYTFTNVRNNGQIRVHFKRSQSHIDPVEVKKTAMSLAGIAENSNPFLRWNYAENIMDGRGIIFGISSFTSGVYTGTKVIQALKEIDSTHPLVQYLPAFEAIDVLPHNSSGITDVVAGLENFIRDWTLHGEDRSVMQAQLTMLNELYWKPAQLKAEEYGFTLPVSMAISYETLVYHGLTHTLPSKGLTELLEDTRIAMGGTPKEGVDELTFMRRFIEIRLAYMRPDTGWTGWDERVRMYEAFLYNGYENLQLPLPTECYDDQFSINGTEIDLTLNSSFHSIDVTVGMGGYIAPYGNVRVPNGCNAYFGISTDGNHDIQDVRVDGVSHGVISNYTFTNVSSDHTIEAVFSAIPIRPKVTITSGPNGTTDPQAVVEVIQGADLVINCIPDSGYEVASATIDNIPANFSGNQIVLQSIYNDTSVHVKFKIVEPACTLFEYVQGQVYTGGDKIHWKGHDYKAKWWTQNEMPPGTSGVWENLGECGPPPITYYFSATAGPEGTINPYGTIEAPEGSVVEYTITPDPGYAIASVFLDGVDQGNITSLSVTADGIHVINVTFKGVPPMPYTITTSAGPNGTISPYGAHTHVEGTIVECTITPDNGYVIDDVTVNGVSQGPVPVLSVKLDDDIYVHATFKPEDVGIPTWSPESVSYSLTDQVRYAGVVYICKYAHVSNSAWVPGTPGLWIWEVK